jgi:hypothetical protein
MPLAGIIWLPSEQLKFLALLPEPRIIRPAISGIFGSADN